MVSCVRVRGVIKSVITFFITVWSGATPAEDSGLPRMVVQTTAQILGCSLLCITFLYPSWENSEDVSLTFLTEPIYTTLSVALEEGQGLSGPGSVGFQNGTYPEAVLNVMGLGGTHYRQFILLIDFTSVLIVFFIFRNWLPFFLLQYVYLSCLARLIGGFTAIICSGYFIGRIWCTSVYTATCES